MEASIEQMLESAAQDGSIDADEWPRVLDAVLGRLDQIVHNEFPVPRMPAPLPAETTHTTQDTLIVHASQGSSSSQDGSQAANKENAPPPSSPPRPAPTSAPQTQQQQQDADSEGASQAGIPESILQHYQAIRDTLTKNFPKHPPHTVQRLAELVLRPKSHYRFLPSYLSAVDRVISVSSSTTLFPLPQAVLPSSSLGSLPNGTSGSSSPSPSAAALGSDESLGGALLTPIPWLQAESGPSSAGGSTQATSPPRAQGTELRSESSEMVEGPNGAGRIETVSVVSGSSPNTSPSSTSAPTNLASNSATSPPSRDAGGVTQGELLRQEQEAGVVPSTQAGETYAPSSPGEDQDKPHARGPEEMTMEDTGPMRRIGGRLNMEAAVGRPAQKSEGDEDEEQGEKMDENDAASEEKEGAAAEKKDESDDTMGDAEGGS